MKCPFCKSELKILLPLPKGVTDFHAYKCECGRSFWYLPTVSDYILNVIQPQQEK